MSAKGNVSRPKVFGSAVVSPRGQIVIPVSARRELGIDSADTLLVCGPPHGQGLLLIKVDAVEQMLSMLGEQLTNFENMVKDYKLTETNGEGEVD
jgi:bifunctional DNA-binding transcriptional regulator/antitoxin component of YhaV-PrlF toxin-antitoxin module